MKRNLAWARNALLEVYSNECALDSVAQSFACAQTVLRARNLRFRSGREFCLALNAAYFDAQSSWGTVSQEDAEYYYGIRAAQSAPKVPRLEAESPKFPSYPKELLAFELERECTRLGFPKFTNAIYSKTHASFLFHEARADDNRSLRLTIEGRLKGTPTLNGSLQQFDGSKPVFRIPLATALCRIRWQFVPEGSVATPDDIVSTIVEPLTVYSVFRQHFFAD